MAKGYDYWLERWRAAGLMDAETLARIQAHEASSVDARRMSGPVALLLALGGLAIGHGILLFVAAHWDEMSPAARFALVVFLVGGFHIGGAIVAARFRALAMTLHAVGTAALGAGIFLAGQIFHLEVHWSGGVMLWAMGAWIAWALLRDWPQLAFVALLTPAWLLGEWSAVADHTVYGGNVMGVGLFMFALAYCAATPSALARIGAIGLIPAFGMAVITAKSQFHMERTMAADPTMHPWLQPLSPTTLAFGWTVAIGLPIVIAWWLRGRAAWPVAVGAAWAVMMIWTAQFNEAIVYLWCAVGALGIVGWGLLESRGERINLGVALFALTVLAFYFSSVFDMFGRATSLIVLGGLLLLGGWLLERLRRRLIARIAGATP